MSSNFSISTEFNEFENGQQAIDYLRNNIINVKTLPDAIFLDFFAPVIEGWKFSEGYTFIQSRIRDKITLLIISSFSSYDNLEQMKATTRFVTKTIVKYKIIEIIESVFYYQLYPVDDNYSPQIYLRNKN